MRLITKILPPPLRAFIQKRLFGYLISERPGPREALAYRYITGSGIEIGALHMPMVIPSSASVKYIDRMCVADLREQYPELNNLPLVEADIVDNGEELGTIADESLDFVIAAHMIEHTQNPLGALENWLRVVKPGGIIFLAVPHRDHTFDADRHLTTWEHVWNDYREGPQWSRRQHFEEWVDLVNKTPAERRAAEIAQLMEMDYSIHFHVWNENSFLGFLSSAANFLKFTFRVMHFELNHHEMLVILRKD